MESRVQRRGSPALEPASALDCWVLLRNQTPGENESLSLSLFPLLSRRLGTNLSVLGRGARKSVRC
jgi:hypothetical protein